MAPRQWQHVGQVLSFICMASLQKGPYWRCGDIGQFYPPVCSPKSECSGWVTNNKLLGSAYRQPQGASYQWIKCFRRDCPPQTLNGSPYVQEPLSFPSDPIESLSQSPGKGKDRGRWPRTLGPSNRPSIAHQKPFPDTSPTQVTNTFTIYEAFDTYLHILFPCPSHRTHLQSHLITSPHVCFIHQCPQVPRTYTTNVSWGNAWSALKYQCH